MGKAKYIKIDGDIFPLEGIFTITELKEESNNLHGVIVFYATIEYKDTSPRRIELGISSGASIERYIEVKKIAQECLQKIIQEVFGEVFLEINPVFDPLN